MNKTIHSVFKKTDQALTIKINEEHNQPYSLDQLYSQALIKR